MLSGYFFSEFSLFCQKVDIFHPLNQNDDLKESKSRIGVGVIGILGVGAGIGPYTFRLRNPASYIRVFYEEHLKSKSIPTRKTMKANKKGNHSSRQRIL